MNDEVKKALEVIRESGFKVKLRRVKPKAIRISAKTRRRMNEILTGGEVCVMTPPDHKGIVRAWSWTNYESKAAVAARAREARAAKKKA